VNCDRIARWYRWLEYLGFGRALERRRFAFLTDVADGRRILVLGDGDGRFLARLVQQNQSASIDYVDLSGKMLALARSRAGTERVTYHHADALMIPLPATTYDLIVTHFFLDCLNEADAALLAEKLAAAAQPGARWIVSEFRDRSAWTSAIVSMLYFFFRITTGLRTRKLIDHHKIFVRKGLCLLRDETSVGGLLASELWTIGSR
jgi:ubiquinone/menaquinone biosynthesis C-methylase UbiE